MPLMGSLYIGSSGLQTSQNALNTTAHNLSNIDTTGYLQIGNDIFGNSKPILSIDTESCVIVPNTIDFDDLESAIWPRG